MFQRIIVQVCTLVRWARRTLFDTMKTDLTEIDKEESTGGKQESRVSCQSKRGSQNMKIR